MKETEQDLPAAPRDVTDSSLLRRLRLGSEDAATQLYLRYAQRLYALARAQSSPELARRVDPEEIVQSVFGSFFRKAGSGDYEVPHGEDLWKLFLVMALNKVRAKGAFHSAAKRDARRTTGGEHLDETVPVPEGQDTAALGLLQLTIEEAMAGLAPPHRQVVNLRVEGYEVAEIAQQTGRSKRSVERLLQEARTRLSYLLHEE